MASDFFRTSAATFFCVLAGALLLKLPNEAFALSCGTYEKGVCHGEARQYAGGFDPKVGFGGFGGGECVATRTPVIFVHGNGDSAVSWDAPPGTVAGFPAPPRSVYAEFRARGYNDCELFGVTYLAEDERKLAKVGKNYHHPGKYKILRDFLRAVQAYTGHANVDIVAHSLGVSQSLAMLHHYQTGASVRKFVNIAGGLRGLYSCKLTGFASMSAPTCNSQSLFNRDSFGFYPEGFAGALWVRNQWTGSGTERSMRAAPRYRSATMFYTISAGFRDQVACSSSAFWNACNQTSRFDDAPNVRAQLDIGAGDHAAQVDLDWSDYSPFNLMGGDSSQGIGHFRARDNAGSIIVRMLATDCTGLTCADDYAFGPKLLY